MPDPNDPRVQQMMAQLQQMMSQSASQGPVNWDLARQIAQSQLSNDPAPSSPDTQAVIDALRLADLWLEDATSLPSGMTKATAWNRGQWVANSADAWKELAEPLADKMTEALNGLMPDDIKGMLGPMAGLMKGIGSSLFGAQVGQAMAELAKEVLSSTEIGLPLGPAGTAALLPGNIKPYAEGMTDVEDGEVRLYLALRETAHHRLYGHVPWLRAHVIGAVEAYASGIHIDEEAIESLAADLDFSDSESMRQIDLSELFRPEDTPAQQAALARLEHILALIGGWVSHVAGKAADNRLASLGKLTESARRRRATGGPSERTFATLVGLNLSPKRLREATALWEAVTAARGVEERDQVWSHPDLIPTPDDLADPDGFAQRDSALSDLDMSIFDQLSVNDPREDKDEDDGSDGKSPA
ncbi:MAG TPA: zinc-dependent metalloprotease [Candidatus Stackebrandtia excrementipullorum]|nr:zinc-dependent metalloprotease [Candidatus Stackebrandtia excrementipullorum]